MAASAQVLEAGTGFSRPCLYVQHSQEDIKRKRNRLAQRKHRNRLKENKFVEAQEPSSAKQGSHTADPIVPSLALEDIALERVHSRATSVDQPSHEKLNAIPLPSPASTHDSIHPLELEIYGESVPRETLDNMESRAWTLQHDLPMSVSQPLFHAGMPAAGDLSPWHKSGYNHRLDIPQDPVNETLTWRKPSSTQAALHTTLAEQDPFLSDASRIDGYHHEIADLPQTGHLQATSFSSHTLEVSHSLTSSVFIRSQERDTAGASLERRLEQVLSASETAGFETVDEMMATYYTADLTEDSASGWAQSRSRKRSLYTFLAKLHENVSAWSSADAQGYYRHMTEATEMLCVNEFLHARKALGDSQISGAQSPDIAQEPALSSSQGQTPSGKTVIRVQMPELWSLLTQLTRKAGLDHNQGSRAVTEFLSLLLGVAPNQDGPLPGLTGH